MQVRMRRRMGRGGLCRTWGQKKKPSAVAGKVSSCFGALVGAKPKTVRGCNSSGHSPSVGATDRREVRSPYLDFLVVDFLVVDFLAEPPDDFFAVAAFFVAMAL